MSSRDPSVLVHGPNFEGRVAAAVQVVKPAADTDTRAIRLAKAKFDEALKRGEPTSRCEILGFRWTEPALVLQAVIKDHETGLLGVFELCRETGRPRFISALDY